VSRRSAIWLIARRELQERGRSKAFLIATAILLCGALAAAIVPALISDSGRSTYDVGIVSPRQEVDRQVAVAASAAGVGARARSLPDRAAARSALRDERVDVAVIGGTEVLLRRPLEDDSSGLGRLSANLAVILGLSDRLARAGVDPAGAADALAGRPVPVRSVEPANDGDDGVTLAFAGLILLYAAILGYGSWVLNGVIEEKSSRVVEVLLASVRPSELLAGKTLGIGLLGLGQLTAVAVPAAIVAVLAGSADLPAASVGGVAAIVLWFALGFAFYCLAYAAAGALTSRQEDAQAASGPLTLAVLVAFFASMAALSEPDSALAHVLSFVPFTAPMVMLVRTVQGEVGAGEIVAALAVMALATLALWWIASRVYAGAILSSGPRLRLRQALRAAREAEPARPAEASEPAPEPVSPGPRPRAGRGR